MVTVAKKKLIDPRFGQRLRLLREAAGLTLVELGQKAGMTYQEVGRFERAEREPTWATFVKLADALGVRLDDFRGANADDDQSPGDRGANDLDPPPSVVGKRK